MDSPIAADDKIRPSAEALAWTQSALGDAIRQLLTGSYLNIIYVGHVITSMNELRSTLGLPVHPSKETIEYRGLHIVSCTMFQKMDQGVRRGLPGALLAALGLTEAQAPQLLGVEGWSRLKTGFDAWSTAWEVGSLVGRD